MAEDRHQVRAPRVEPHVLLPDDIREKLDALGPEAVKAHVAAGTLPDAWGPHVRAWLDPSTPRQAEPAEERADQAEPVQQIAAAEDDD